MSNQAGVAAGEDAAGKRLVVEGTVPLDRKLLPHQVDGRLFIYEHRGVGRGGPPLHVHHAQEEWLYVLEGEIMIELDGVRSTLRPGDSALAPRGIPHSWANLTDAPASLIFLASPAADMEGFFAYLDGRRDLPKDELADLYSRHGMTLLGEPLSA